MTGPYVALGLLFVLTNCSGVNTPSAEEAAMDTIVATDHDHSSYDEPYEYEDLFVTIADTGASYRTLSVLMDSLAIWLPAEVDLMGRIHDERSDSIMLPLDNEDEPYAGSYYPRRYVGSTLSMEYLRFYDTTAAGGTMAIVAGIWVDSTEAAGSLNELRAFAPNAHMVRATLYQGCIH